MMNINVIDIYKSAATFEDIYSSIYPKLLDIAEEYKSGIISDITFLKKLDDADEYVLENLRDDNISIIEYNRLHGLINSYKYL